jgi:hypothetical protein
MSLSKRKFWYSNHCLHFPKRAVPLELIEDIFVEKNDVFHKKLEIAWAISYYNVMRSGYFLLWILNLLYCYDKFVSFFKLECLRIKIIAVPF